MGLRIFMAFEFSLFSFRVFQYIERRPTDKIDVMSAYKLSSYPKQLHKKVTLLQHFRSYLEGHRTQTTSFTVKKTRITVQFYFWNIQVTFDLNEMQGSSNYFA